jgi:hypothetical protein
MHRRVKRIVVQCKGCEEFFTFFQNRHNNRVEQIINRLDLLPECRILDIGAGPGAIVLPIHDKVQHITAMEPSSGMVEVLKKKFQNMRPGTSIALKSIGKMWIFTKILISHIISSWRSTPLICWTVVVNKDVAFFENSTF